MKKFLAWLKSPKSDFALFIIVLILLNLVGQRAFFRADLTSSHTYSLSKASKQVVQSLEQPLTVKVFFSDNLPAPYNTVDQYLKDLLVEYKGNSRRNFNYEFFDMAKPENEGIAKEYGISQYQIQEVNNNEVGIKAVYMGLVLIYSDRIEVIDPVQSSDGLEYKLTTAISNMVATTNTLAGLSDNVQMTLYVSSRLSDFGIQGLDQIDQIVLDAYNNVNKKNLGKISYSRVDPKSAEAAALSEKYGLQSLSFKEKDGSISYGALGLILEYGNASRTIPIQVAQSFFGTYGITGLDTLEESISDNLRSLVSRSLEIGYITGHNEDGLDDQQTAHGAAFLPGLVSDTYSITQINLAEENIPGRISAIIINGPKSSFSESELYKIDQFLMRGGNVMFFLDPFTEEDDYSLYNYTGQVTTKYTPLDTGLDRLLEKYGVSLGKNYVMDKECYTQSHQSYGKLSLYWIPIIRDANIDQTHAITKNLGNIVYLQSGSVDILPTATADATVLLKSSQGAWTQSEAIMLNPLYMNPDDVLEQENLAVILEGNFESAFDSDPDLSESGSVSTSSHIASSVQPGKIFVTGTSYVTSIQLIDEQCTQPVSVFVRNIIDYMNNAADLCTMRSKGLSVATLTVRNKNSATFWQMFCQYGLVVVALIVALILWRIRVARRRQIRLKFDPDDSREEENIQKAVSDEEGAE